MPSIGNTDNRIQRMCFELMTQSLTELHPIGEHRPVAGLHLT